MTDATWTPKGSIKVIAKRSADGWTDVKSLIRHPMDSGFESRAKFVPVPPDYMKFVPIPPHYIQTLSFRHQGKTVFLCDWGPAVSKDPFLQFRFKGASIGDTLEIHWIDNEGLSDSATAKIA